MKTISFLAFFLILLQKGESQLVFNIELSEAPTSKVIKLKTTVLNKSRKPLKVLESRTVDYVRSNIVALGSYIIELQRKEGNSYVLVSPTSDINPQFSGSDFISIESGQSISDTLRIEGYSFRQTTNPGDNFPAGQYRIRAAFNTNGSRDKMAEFTKWIEFAIIQVTTPN